MVHMKLAQISATLFMQGPDKGSQIGRTCRSSRSSTQDQPLCLSKSDVASVCQRCNTQTTTVSYVLIGVFDLSITDVDLGFLALLVLVVA